MAVRPEVVDLGAVRRVVVDHDQHPQPEARHRLELRQRHHRAAVAERRHGQPVRPGHRRADGAGQPQPDRLKRLGEDEALRVRHPQVHRRVAHEVAGVDGHGPLGRQQVVERSRQRARIDRASPCRRPRTASPARCRRGCARRSAGCLANRRPSGDARHAVSSASSAARRLADIADDGHDRTRWWAPIASASWSIWITVARRAEQPAVARRPHVQRRPRRPARRPPAAISSAAAGEAKPPEMPSAHGLPANRPLATADVASSAPSMSASCSSGSRASASTAPRPAMISGALARASASAASTMAAAAGRTGRSGGGVRRHGVPIVRALARPGRRAAASAPPAAARPGRGAGPQRRRRRPWPGRAAARRPRRPTAPVVLLDPEVGADRRGGRVGRQHQQRRPTLGRLGQAGHGVGQARPLVHAADADPPLTWA